MKTSLENELNFAKHLAKSAGKILLENQNTVLDVEIKSDNSPVTRIDKKVSKFLSENMTELFPDYGILDEESEEDGRDKTFCWVTDPIDGTISYINGDPTFGVFIGLLQNLKPVLGVTYKPKKDELCYAYKGTGAFLETSNQTKRLYVSNENVLDVLVSKNRANSELKGLLKKLSPHTVKPMFSSFKTVEVAKGNATLFLCPSSISLNLWDLCAPTVILEEAGGKLTDLYGNPINYSDSVVNKNGVIASNKRVYDNVLEVVL